MTVIVGLKDRKGVYLGGDSAASEDNKVISRRDEKVFVNGPFIFGFSSSFRMGQLLRFKLEIPKQKRGLDDYEYMSTVFIDAVRKCLMADGFLKGKTNLMDGNFIVAYKNNLYEIDCDFQVGMTNDSYVAIGSGDEFALGALYACTNKNPVDKVVIALEAAAKFSAQVKPPFTIIKKLNRGEPEYLEAGIQK